MYHSITFGDGTLDSDGNFTGKNTWDDWFLIPSSKPIVAQSAVTTSFVDIPGRRLGPIDMTEYLTGGVTYGNRSGSFEFYIDNDMVYWETDRMAIAQYLHGKRMKMCLEDDPGFYYEGRFSLSNMASEAITDKITINYTVGPYKFRIKDNLPCLWSPFNFDWDSFNQQTSNEGWL